MAGSAEVAEYTESMIRLKVADEVANRVLSGHAKEGLRNLALGIGASLYIKAFEKRFGKGFITKTGEVAGGAIAGIGLAKLAVTGISAVVGSYLSMQAETQIRDRLLIAQGKKVVK